MNGRSRTLNSRWRCQPPRGQASLELMLAMVTGLFLVVASMKVWLFFVQVIVEEQRCYQRSRRFAGDNNNPGLGWWMPPQFRDGGLWASNPPAYGNPFWGPRDPWGNAQVAEKPRLAIFGPIQLPNKCN